MISRVANTVWAAANRRRWRRFRKALARPGAEQRELLAGYLRRHAASRFGIEHGFARIDSVEAYRRNVPLCDYEALRDPIARIRRGETGVLGCDPVTRLVPSSGSTAARKLIPYTRSLLDEFSRAIGPWIVDLYRQQPELMRGPAYWSISPVAAPAATADDDAAAVPVGFDEDSAYLGGLWRRVVDRTLAVPAAVREHEDMEAFRRETLLHLLRARELRLISVWHPSFLGLLLDALPREWDGLLARLDDRRRVAELERIGPAAPEKIWPALGLVSCWSHGASRGPAAELATRLPGVAIQAKGLLATEACVTIPFGVHWPVAVRSHLFEFLDDAGRPHLVDELRRGAEYSVVVTTGGGLYRYRLGDRVRVEGAVGMTPSLAFIGRDDRVSDRCGEKLSDGFVASVLARELPATLFAMLAPDGGGYTLYVAGPLADDAALGHRVDRGLCANPHYDNCIRLGQLSPLRVCRVAANAHERYVAACRARGQRAGDVKPVALGLESGWTEILGGRYVVEDVRRSG